MKFLLEKEREGKKIVAVSGYFDPLHVGHLEYLTMASKLGNHLCVIVNNDHQCKLKKGKSFMPEEDRLRIIQSLKMVDYAMISIDYNRTVCTSLEFLRPQIFANGGDRHNQEIPEAEICKRFDIKIVDGLGDKIRSSSDLTGLKSSN
tara:strand:- start:467 stop:907 length:441 start_codon:yes stop_codon:yes gene_type:complete